MTKLFTPASIRPLSKLTLVGEIDDFYAGSSSNFETMCEHMAEKFDNEDAKKSDLNDQMEFRKRSIRVAARGSALSKAQVHEVESALSDISFIPHFVETTGDKDLTTSLRTLGKSDFFTKEVDQLLLEGTCRLAIHSAKDLPDPLLRGLELAALTQGLDPSDSLVFNEPLPLGALIGTSCARREEAVKALRSDLRCVDIRGSIERRLQQLDEGKFQGIVVAEAALIRLGLTHRKRLPLPGETAPLQGRLAILCRQGDQEMLNLVASLDTRKKVLYLGLDPSHFKTTERVIHYPVIRIKPLMSAPLDLSPYSHILFTSKTAVSFFAQILPGIKTIAIGQVTAAHLVRADYVAQEETQEGVITLLRKLDLRNAHLFWPHSARARPALTQFLEQDNIRYTACALYDTLPQKLLPVPDLDTIDEIVFTSPSTVDAFLQIYPKIPQDKQITAIGSITRSALGANEQVECF